MPIPLRSAIYPLDLIFNIQSERGFPGQLMSYDRLHLGVIDNNQVFISHSFPFVCRNTPSVIPFVYRNHPFVERHKLFSGFTLIELIITLTIIAILLGIVGPNMGTFVTSNRLTTQANEFIADLNLARSEAIKQASNVGVCASSTGTSCTGNWQNGWIVFLDADASLGWTASDSVLRTHESLSGNNTLGGTQTTIVFNKSGVLASAAAAGNYTLCNSQSGKSRVINVQTTGRPTLSEGSC